jgi:glycosyltransferase involved in cell wall biosynthesis
MVSVIIPTRDRKELLESAVNSVLSQTWPRIECIVVDDGSSPPAEVPADPRVRLLRLDDSRGPGAARNAGVSVAAGDLTCFLDDDDVLVRDRIGLSVLQCVRLSECSDLLLDLHLKYFRAHPRAHAFRLFRLGMLELRAGHPHEAGAQFFASLRVRLSWRATKHLLGACATALG